LDDSGAVALDGAPATSPQSAAFFARLREHLRSRLFGTTQQKLVPEPEPPPRVEGDLPVRIGRYDVIGRIGSGGMGVIYSAFDRALGRKVAVKLINPRGTNPEQARVRLLREAKALARLSHPNIVHVYEVGTFEDGVFVAMEFVEGTTLRRWQSLGDRPWRQVLAAYIAAGQGVAAGHEAGVVHRDFKPDNVLVRRDDEVRVIDFGLARTQADPVPFEPQGFDETTEGEVALTKTGTLMGTPAYMAPEQFKGEPADARSDQFAFCIALYEALYGYRPFAGATVKRVATNVLTGKVEPPPKYTDVPEKVYRVLLRGLEVLPEDRYPDLKHLLDELPSDGPRSLRWFAGALVLLGLGAGGSVWAMTVVDDANRAAAIEALRSDFVAARGAEAEARLRRAWGRSRGQRFNELVLRTAEELVGSDPTQALASLKRLDPADPDWITPARLIAAEAESHEVVVRRLAVGVGPVTHVASDRTGDRLAIGAGNQGVLVHPGPDGAVSGALAGEPFEVTSLAMNDDGNLVVAAGRDGAVRLWRDPDVAPEIFARHRGGATAVAISADGTRIASGGADGRVVIGEPAAKTRSESKEHAKAVRALALSFDGSILASAGDDAQVRIAFLGQDRRWVLPHRGSVPVKALAFNSDGAYLDCLGDDGFVWRVRTDERRGTLLEAPPGISLIAASPRGQEVALYSAGQALRLFAEEGQPTRELFSRSVTALAVSGDGRSVIAAGGDRSIRRWKVRRRADSTYRFRDAVVLAMAHTPIGNRLAIGTSTGVVRLWDVASDETPQIGQLVGGVHALMFSPDGTRLAALGGLGGISVWTLGEDAEPESLVPAAFELPIQWHADGTRIAAQLCDSPRRCGLVVHDLDAHERLLATQLGAPLRSFGLSEGGRWALAVRASSPDSVELFDLQTGEQHSPPWAEEHVPSQVVAHRFSSDATSVRLAARDGDRLALWHWSPTEELLALLDEVEVDSVIADPAGTALLLRGVEGDEVWVLDEPLRRPIGPLPETIDHFELASDRSLALVVSKGRATVIHLATGIRRTVAGIEEPFVWRGLSAFAMAEERQLVRLRSDPTPDDPDAFLAWLDRITDAVVDDYPSR
jgi:WD40 repeat protein/predicted Ser/Thr protein kinase